MDIDITDERAREITKIINMYPQGHLEIKNERVFWCSDHIEPITDSPQPPMGRGYPQQQPPRQQSGMSNAAQGFKRSLDVLGQMVC